jgi:hypothetical protein
MPNTVNQFPIRHVVTELTIPAGQASSNAVVFAGTDPVKIVVPSEFTGTAIHFEVSYNPGEFETLESGGEIYEVPVLTERTEGSAIALDLHIMLCVQELRLVSNDTEAAERTLKIISRSV